MNKREQSIPSAFELQWTREIPAINITAYFFVHKKTGAEIIHLKNSDKNRTFGIAFTTLPKDSTGIAHILEHSVLAGSKKYPAKDPFALLYKTSMKTFLNAITFPDKTVYPVSSKNEKDLKNLMSVYLDSVFHPLLTEETFSQEGWHQEVDEKGMYSLKGVVYNEMKGQLSNPDSLFYYQVFPNLFTEPPYTRNTGGDPAIIPSLTIEELKRFHKKYYTPANSRVFFYGDLDIAGYMQLLLPYLEEGERTEIENVPIQKHFTKPVTFTGTLPTTPDKIDAGNIAGKIWLLGTDAEPVLSQKEYLAFNMLAYYIAQSDASPIRRALLQSSVGESFIDPLFETEMQQNSFYIALRGVPKTAVKKLYGIIDHELEMAAKGIDPAIMESIFTRFEFHFKEMEPADDDPKAISLFKTMLSTWLYGRDPLQYLDLESSFAELRSDLANKTNYFEGLIKKHLINNPHRVDFNLVADKDYSEEKHSEEVQMIKTMESNLNAEEKIQIRNFTTKLEQYQKAEDTPEAIKSIPNLNVTDLSKNIEKISSVTEKHNGITTHFVELPTNEIVYTNLVFDISHLSTDEKQYLPVIGRLLFKLATKNHKSEAIAVLFDKLTGGISADVFVKTAFSTGKPVEKFIISTKFLHKNYKEVVSLLADVIKNLDFTNKGSIYETVSEISSAMDSDVVDNGHAYALYFSRAGLHDTYNLQDRIRGISYIKAVSAWKQSLTKNDSFVNEISSIYRKLFTKKELLLSITSDNHAFVETRDEIEHCIYPILSDDQKVCSKILQPISTSAAVIIPTQVAYNALSFRTNIDSISQGALIVSLKSLHIDYLWKEVRQKGGAYSAGPANDLAAKLFSFYSYRDPKIARTYETYQAAGDFLFKKSKEYTQRDIDNLIIGTIAQLTPPLNNEEMGAVSLERYLVGQTDELRQKLHNEILEATAEKIAAVGTMFSKMIKDKTSHATLCGKELLTNETTMKFNDTIEL